MDLSKVSEGGHSEPSCSGGGSGGTNKNVNGINARVPIRKIYIHPIQPNMANKIRAHFGTYGEIELFKERKKGDFRFGFVQFKDAAAVETVLLKKRHRIGRRVINVKAAYPHQQPDYARIISNPSMVPPDQDDDKHILKALNGDCFREIFKRLDLPDLVNVAEVCTRFNHEAKETFAYSKYKDMVFTGTDQPNKIRKTIRHFGAYIRSLCIESNSGANDYLLRAMLDYCTKKLTELRLEYFRIRDESPELGQLFSRLEKLELMDCDIHTQLDRLLAECTKLKVLRLEECDLSNDGAGIGRAFENLREAHFSHVLLMSAENIQQFIVSNPNVTKLTIKYSTFGSTEKHLLLSIGQSMPNLLELEFRESDGEANLEDVLSIGQLTQLRVLKLDFEGCKAAPLLNAFCTNNVPIEHLKMIHARIDDDAVEYILKMNRMKVLEVEGARDLTNDHLIGWAKGLPELQELRLDSVDADLTTIDLKKIISYAGKLKYMQLKEYVNFTIDLDDYNVMLHAVQNRREKVNLLIEIESNEKMVNVPEETLNEYRHDFFIDEQVIGFDDSSIGNDSSDLWYNGMDSDQYDFDDFDYFSDADSDDDDEPMGYFGGHQVFLG